MLLSGIIKENPGLCVVGVLVVASGNQLTVEIPERNWKKGYQKK